MLYRTLYSNRHTAHAARSRSGHHYTLHLDLGGDYSSDSTLRHWTCTVRTFVVLQSSPRQLPPPTRCDCAATQAIALVVAKRFPAFQRTKTGSATHLPIACAYHVQDCGPRTRYEAEATDECQRHVKAADTVQYTGSQYLKQRHWPGNMCTSVTGELLYQSPRILPCACRRYLQVRFAKWRLAATLDDSLLQLSRSRVTICTVS